MWSSEANPAPNPRVFGKYDVLRRLAVGGMGEIFLARQVGVAGFERLVTLKSLLPQLADNPDMLGQFLDEARIVGSINHPSVVACYEVGEWRGVYFFAMEYVNGADIAALQQACDDKGRRFPINVALAVTREAALGLDSAHQACDAQGQPLKVVHRDISPQNVMVRADGLTKIVDFGVAFSTNRHKRTEGGLLKGKLGYMAPEQIKGQGVDARSDQFSLGVLLWEMLAGRRLFVGDSAEAVFMQIVRDTVPPPSSLYGEIPADVDALVLRMTAADPKDRYARLADVAAHLRRLLDARGAGEHEVADLVSDVVGDTLAERVRDQAPRTVRILGIRTSAEGHAADDLACRTCRAVAVLDDRFCRACGAALATLAAAPTQLRASPAVVFAEVDDPSFDIDATDDLAARECAVASGCVEFVDVAGAHPAQPSLFVPLVPALQELATRYGGVVSTNDNRLSATFLGNDRAARGAVAFARRAAALVQRAHRDLRLRMGVAAEPSVGQGDTSARDNAERMTDCARPGQVLVSERAKRLANVAHAYSAGVEVPARPPQWPQGIVTWVVPEPPRIVGRATERLIVDRALAAAAAGRGQQLLFLGEAGAGKSTLLDAVDTEARDRGFVVARARCARSRASLTFDAIRQAVRSACEEVAVLTQTQGPWDAVLDTLAMGAFDKRKLRALVNDEPLKEDIPQARRRVLLRAALQSFFAALASSRGVCVVIDDIHAADRHSVDLFAELAARLHQSRLAIVAAGRPLRGERTLPLAKRVVLEALDDKDIAGVIGAALGGHPPLEVSGKIAERARGNPLLAVLLARFLASMRLVHLSGDIVTASPDLARYPLPPNLSVLTFASQALLTPNARAALEACAAVGQVAPLTQIAALLPAVDVDAALTEALGCGALVYDTLAGEPAAAFPSASELDAVVRRTTPGRAQTMHRALADALGLQQQQRFAIEREELSLFHRRCAGDVDAACDHAERAADAWAALGATDVTTEHYKIALAHRFRRIKDGAVSEDEAARAFELVARATISIGDVQADDAVNLLMPFLRAVPVGTAVRARIDAESARAALLLKLRRTHDALAELDRLAEAPVGDATAHQQGALLLDLAVALEQSGNPTGARTQLNEAIVKLSADGGCTRLFEAYLAQGRLALRASQHAAARAALKLALAEASHHRRVAQMIDALSLLSMVELAAGDSERSLAVLDDALSAAAAAGDSVAAARLKQQAARVLQQIGRHADALDIARQALLGAQVLGWDEGASVATQLVHSLQQRA